MEDFSVSLATEEGKTTYTLRAQEMETYPEYIARHIKKHLAQHIYNIRTGGRITKESIMPAILAEIEI